MAAVSSPAATFRVTRVIDGDTIEVTSSDSAKLTVRFIGINAPEKNACLFAEAKQKMVALVGDQAVALIPDRTQGDRDKYQRLLRYVELADGLDAGEELIGEGLAKEYTYGKKYERQGEYRAREVLAKQEGAGIWSNSSQCEEN